MAVDPAAGVKFKVSDKQKNYSGVGSLPYYRSTNYQIAGRTTKNVPYRYTFHNYALLPDRLELHQRIEQRLSKMWDIGF